ncbi:MAG: hypothetical protein JST16_13005, partial [Bdellovibrionales bacterium]|nr:hypothetical protein [Bdellovibrionales bacterium]
MGSLNLNSKNPAKWVHFVAIGGTGMGALAALLQDDGWFVTGSDGPLYPPMSEFLARRGMPLKASYDASHITGAAWGLEKSHPDLVVIGNAISRGHVEAEAVEKLGLRRMSFPEALAEFSIRDRRSFVVAGTHGKTTTTSVLAWALESLGRAPGFLIGGIPKNFNQGCHVGAGKVFVTEGDEYDTAYWDKGSKFLHYRPSWVLCTGIEFDHADIFKNVAAIEDSFLKLADLTREGWLLVDDESSPRAASVQRVAQSFAQRKIPCHRYGAMASSRYRLLGSEARRLPNSPSGLVGTACRIQTPELGTIELLSPMTGYHNALNLTGVVGTLLASGEAKTTAQLQTFLDTFAGVKRRQDEVFASPALVVIDDFAHHPTAIRETVRAIRDRYPTRKLAAFFEPRSATSARNVMAAQFAECFDDADSVFLVTPTKTNIPAGEKLDVPALVAAMGDRPALKGKTLTWKASIPELAEAFGAWQKNVGGSGVVALVMSNGPFGGLHGMLAK